MTVETISATDPRWGKPDPTHDPRLLANFKPRHDDVLITTAPKAGTTWMQNILHQLRSGGDPDFENIDSVVPWLELPRDDFSPSRVLAGYEAIDSPRIFKTHCTREQTPGIGTLSIILSSRDPRDCMVSFYHHMMDMTDEARIRSGFAQLQTFDDVFELWMKSGAWYRNVASWWPYFDHDRLLWLRYEDMKQDIDSCVDQILEFLRWEITAAQRQAVNRYISFDWMKANADKFIMKFRGQPVFKPDGFIRKGQVGDHQQTLSASQEEQILDKAGDLLETSCLRYLGL